MLAHVELECSTGDILGIFGRNGSGKSTLLKLIFGILKADAISYSINDIGINPADNLTESYVSYLPQDSFLPKSIKVRDVIPLMFPKEEKQDNVFYDAFIAKIAARTIGTLSLGELRYLEVILIGNLDSKFLMLDEPFSMIEPLHKDAIKEYFQKIRKSKGIILTDHYYEDVLNVTDRNIVLKKGRSIAVKDQEDLKKFGYLNH